MRTNIPGHLAAQSPLSVATLRSGVFRFQAAVDFDQIALALQRVADAQSFLNKLPLVPEVAARLKHDMAASGAYASNTIDGGEILEPRVTELLDNPEQASTTDELRIVNLFETNDEIDRLAQPTDIDAPGTSPTRSLLISEAMIKALHASITQRQHHPLNQPGAYRDNTMGHVTKTGTVEHGGIYTPPKCREDIELLMRAFLEWINSTNVSNLSPLIRAPLAHLYFERIHPFWEGNGRVGRALMMLLLKAAGYHYSHYVLARYFLDHKDQYLTLLNPARKADERYPNTAFISFFLDGMFESIERAYARGSAIIAQALFETRLQALFKGKKINARQHTIITELLKLERPQTLGELQAQSWYQSLYRTANPKTRARDLLGLAENQLAALQGDGSIKLSII